MKESSYYIKLKQIVRDTLLPKFRQAAVNLLVDAMGRKEFGDLTGNTLTSYVAGIYENGILYNTITLLDVAYLEHPVLEKLSNDDGIVQIERYDDGHIVTINTSSFVNTDKRFGVETAKDFLVKYTPPNPKGFSLVITTGTEYSEYIEETRKLNVLTETFLWAEGTVADIFNK